MIDTHETRALRHEMVAALIKDGALTDDRWISAFDAVPRHVLVPDYYRASEHIDGQSDREHWLRLVYSDTTLITQRRPDAVTSSGTMPGLVATMLQALEVNEGHRVMQVATGTGYTAALLCERLGSAQVTSIDVDPDLTAAARKRLRHCGYTPTVITGDGADGYPGRAPYDRIIVTFGVTRVPPAWINQTRAGAIIVTPVCSGLAKLTVTGPDHAHGPFIGTGYFMRHRPTPNTSPGESASALANGPRWPERTTELPSSVYYDNDFRFFLGITIPGLAHGYRDGNPRNLMISAPDGSHAHITPEGQLTQFGPRRLWDDIEAVHHRWQSLDAPSRERFGLTVTPQQQTIWLDIPEGSHQWPER